LRVALFFTLFSLIPLTSFGEVPSLNFLVTLQECGNISIRPDSDGWVRMSLKELSVETSPEVPKAIRKCSLGIGIQGVPGYQLGIRTVRANGVTSTSPRGSTKISLFYEGKFLDLAGEPGKEKETISGVPDDWPTRWSECSGGRSTQLTIGISAERDPADVKQSSVKLGSATDPSVQLLVLFRPCQ
jgi:hypothetical protein